MKHMRDLIDAHVGEKFLVCGLGTSLDQFPIEFYEDWDGITIGVNEIYELFAPEYRFDVNAFNAKDYRAFWNRRGEEICYEYMIPSGVISKEKNGLLSMRGSGIVPAITAAYQMGAKEIYLIGADFCRNANGDVYWSGCGKRAPADYQLARHDDPELEATLRCLADAFNMYRSMGVEVYNLSQNSRIYGIETLMLEGE
jgi:hypothetical protein